MRSGKVKQAGVILAGACLIGLGGCTSEDMAMFADAMAAASDEMAVTLTSTPSFGCDYNIDGYLVCDDTGDGFADRYADAYDVAPVAYLPVTPPVRVNGYGEAYQYDGGCDCWLREPSLDEAPPPRDHGHHHDD
ncbi:MAG: hypothetical protein R3B94_09520 [Hyphomonas sp.]|jgi:hypothetical protein